MAETRGNGERNESLGGSISAPPKVLTRSSRPDFGASDVKLLPEGLFKKYSKLIFEECGISLSEQKRLMLSVRISKRLRTLGRLSYKEYLSHLMTKDGRQKELPFLINVVTTNKTDFFREPYHFDFLTRTLLPTLEHDRRFTTEFRLRIWSAGCSTGEEPYTLAFVLSHYFGDRGRCFDILATDISTDALKKAVRAIYSEHTVSPIPKYYRQKYMMRGSGEWENHWRVIPEIRKTVQFGQLNFSDENFGIEDKMHVVFCRNVIIYFSQDTKASVIAKLSNQLLPQGHLFIGHSETLHHLSRDFESVYRTVYQKR